MRTSSLTPNGHAGTASARTAPSSSAPMGTWPGAAPAAGATALNRPNSCSVEHSAKSLAGNLPSRHQRPSHPPASPAGTGPSRSNRPTESWVDPCIRKALHSNKPSRHCDHLADVGTMTMACTGGATTPSCPFTTPAPSKAGRLLPPPPSLRRPSRTDHAHEHARSVWPPSATGVVDHQAFTPSGTRGMCALSRPTT